MSTDFRRSILIGALFFIAFLLWDAWQKEHASPPVPSTTHQTNATTGLEGPLVGPTSTEATTTQTTVPSPSQPSSSQTSVIQVNTDTLKVKIDTAGGNITYLGLPHYPDEIDTPNQAFELLNDNPGTLYLAQSGLVSTVGPDSIQKQAVYRAEKTSYTLAPNQKDLIVNLHWDNGQGVTVIKSFTFVPHSYVIKVSYQIINHAKQAWTGNFYAQLKRKKVEQETHFFQISPYMGAALSSPEKRYEKLGFDQMAKENLNKDIKDGWLAMQEHYFLSAWVPQPDQAYRYTSQVVDKDTYVVRLVSSPLTVAAGQTATTSAKLYAGPAIADQLEQVAPGLDLAVDYGILWILGTALFWLMQQIYSLVHNWGWSIVLVTVLIKLAFYHLSAASYRSMAKMRDLQPRIQALRERYGEDRQKVGQATMELYRSEKVNPLGGCLPMLVQIPVFIALYWVLLESVQLRHAPFVLWIQDLSVPDPYYVLPIIMGLTMFIQQKLSPPPPDPMQAKVMMMLPIIFTVFFLGFPAGLVLYWAVNNALSILQQWFITYQFERAKAKKKPKK